MEAPSPLEPPALSSQLPSFSDEKLDRQTALDRVLNCLDLDGGTLTVLFIVSISVRRRGNESPFAVSAILGSFPPLILKKKHFK